MTQRLSVLHVQYNSPFQDLSSRWRWLCKCTLKGLRDGAHIYALRSSTVYASDPRHIWQGHKQVSESFCSCFCCLQHVFIKGTWQVLCPVIDMLPLLKLSVLQNTSLFTITLPRALWTLDRQISWDLTETLLYGKPSPPCNGRSACLHPALLLSEVLCLEIIREGSRLRLKFSWASHAAVGFSECSGTLCEGKSPSGHTQRLTVSPMLFARIFTRFLTPFKFYVNVYHGTQMG